MARRVLRRHVLRRAATVALLALPMLATAKKSPPKASKASVRYQGHPQGPRRLRPLPLLSAGRRALERPDDAGHQGQWHACHRPLHEGRGTHRAHGVLHPLYPARA